MDIKIVNYTIDLLNAEIEDLTKLDLKDNVNNIANNTYGSKSLYYESSITAIIKTTKRINEIKETIKLLTISYL